ncbi:hypothetical protein FQN54_005201 [Arachnomyces sp. PD_36]|nr:hypothetical protein FQN54_005201 [Arachnomyces sp. PD_36]
MATEESQTSCSHLGDPQPICHIVTPVGMLGYGLDSKNTAAALASLTSTNVPTALILDSGSTDSGPYRLATGTFGVPRSSYVRDLRKLLDLRKKFGVPLLVGSAGGDGSDDHVRELVNIVKEISEESEDDAKLKIITILAEVDKELVSQRLRAGAISGCGITVPPLTQADIDDSPRIVAQMGPEPILQAMRQEPDFDVVMAGRAYDPSPYIAYAAFNSSLTDGSYPADGASKSNPATSLRWGGFTHMGKIMECGGACAEPKGQGAIATVYEDGKFDVTPLEAVSRCTPATVAAHALYEKTRPDILHGPGGLLDLTRSTYTQLSDERTVRVWGGEFLSSQALDEPYRVKLEAGKVTGYRSMYIGGIKDPILIGQIDSFLEVVRGYVKQQHADAIGTWELGFHTYGSKTGPDPDLFLVGEAFASTQELAGSVAATARIATTHGPYAGQKATSGNFAYGIGGTTVIPLGECTEFSIYHLMDLAEGEEGIVTCDEHGVKRSTVDPLPLFGQRTTLVGPASPGTKNLADSTQLGASKTSGSKASMILPPNPTLRDAARVLRSKNSGPFEITFDVVFERESVYRAIKKANILRKDIIARMFNISQEEVVWCGFFDQAKAFKATIPRRRGGKNASAGGFMENDVHGSQQYLPLMKMPLPQSLVEELKSLIG